MNAAWGGGGLGALRHRNFRLFLGGQAVSLTGTWMQHVAQGWLVLTLTDSPFYVGLVSALGSLGVLLFTLYAGVVADRVNRRAALIATQALAMVQALALAALVGSGAVTVGGVIALATVLGVVNAFDIPIRQAFIVEMVGRDDLMNAIALNSSLFNASRVVGPALAGLVIGRAGVEWCFLVNGASYLATIGGLLAMRLPPRGPPSHGGAAWAGLREIAAYARGDARVSALIALTAVLSIFGFPVLTLMPVLARDVLHAGAAGYGILMSAIGIGAVAAALSIAVFSRRLPHGRLQLVGGVAFGLVVAALAGSRSFGLAVLLAGLAGCAMVVNNALTNTMLQTLVPDALRGRVMGVYAFMFVGMGPLGALQAGTVAEHFGAPLAIGIGGLLSALAVAAAWWRVPELRDA
jgi:MFS family permease